jgi:hypothetical protein
VPAIRSSSSATGQTGSTFSVTAPAGIVDGDLLLAFQSNTSTQPATPTGFTFGSVGLPWNAAGSFRLTSFYKVAASESGNYTFNNVGALDTSDVWLLCISGTDGTLRSSSTNSGSSGTTATANSITTVTGNEIVLACFACLASTTIAPVAPLTTIGTISTGVIGSLNTAWLTQSVAGATGNQTATLGSSTFWATILLDFAPAALAPSTVPPLDQQIPAHPSRVWHPAAAQHENLTTQPDAFDAGKIGANIPSIIRGPAPFRPLSVGAQSELLLTGLPTEYDPSQTQSQFVVSLVRGPLFFRPQPPGGEGAIALQSPASIAQPWVEDVAVRGPAPFRAAAQDCRPVRWDENADLSPALLPARMGIEPTAQHRAVLSRPAGDFPWTIVPAGDITPVPDEKATPSRRPVLTAKARAEETAPPQSYLQQRQGWDAPTFLRLLARAFRPAPADGTQTPTTIPDDQQALGSWRSDPAPLRRPPARLASYPGDQPFGALLTADLWTGAIYEAGTNARNRPDRQLWAKQASDPPSVAELLAAPLWVSLSPPGAMPLPRPIRRGAPQATDTIDPDVTALPPFPLLAQDTARRAPTRPAARSEAQLHPDLTEPSLPPLADQSQPQPLRRQTESARRTQSDQTPPHELIAAPFWVGTTQEGASLRRSRALRLSWGSSDAPDSDLTVSPDWRPVLTENPQVARRIAAILRPAGDPPPFAEFLLAPIWTTALQQAWREGTRTRPAPRDWADPAPIGVAYLTLDAVAWIPSAQDLRRPAAPPRPRQQADDAPLFATEATLAALGTPWDAPPLPLRRGTILRPGWSADDTPAIWWGNQIASGGIAGPWLFPAVSLGRGSLLRRPVWQFDDAGASLWWQLDALASAKYSPAWAVPTPTRPIRSDWRAHGESLLVLDITQVQASPLLPDATPSPIRFAQRWQPTGVDWAAPPWQDLSGGTGGGGVIVVAGPYWVAAAGIWWAGAIEGDVQEG